MPAYVVETLDEADYTAEELSDYLTEVSTMQKLRLVNMYVGVDDKLNVVWEAE